MAKLLIHCKVSHSTLEYEHIQLRKLTTEGWVSGEINKQNCCPQRRTSDSEWRFYNVHIGGLENNTLNQGWCFGFVRQHSLLKLPQILSFISHISHFSKGYSNVRLNVTKTRYQHTEFRVLLFIFPGIYRNRSDDTISLCSLPSGAYRAGSLSPKELMGWGEGWWTR